MNNTLFTKARLDAFHKKVELDKCIKKIMDNRASIRYYTDKNDCNLALLARAKVMLKNGEHKYGTYLWTVRRDIDEVKLILKGLVIEQHECKKLRCKLEKEYAYALVKLEHLKNE